MDNNIPLQNGRQDMLCVRSANEAARLESVFIRSTRKEKCHIGAPRYDVIAGKLETSYITSSLK